MTPKRQQRLTIALGVVFGTAIIVGLVMYSLKQNINLFYSTTQIVNGEAPTGARIRVGGMVLKGSLVRDTKSLHVSFWVTDTAEKIQVDYTGILPDLFKEGQGIIAQGKLDAQGIFQADEVLAKHDENYMPPEIADSLKNAKPKTEQVQP
ncbi:MAG: cytochrome c maturation protein CcmE [Methylococcales bacterium]|nr:cytochrome c maturation protein CcmE [Methylococcales bacterium]